MQAVVRHRVLASGPCSPAHVGKCKVADLPVRPFRCGVKRTQVLDNMKFERGQQKTTILVGESPSRSYKLKVLKTMSKYAHCTFVNLFHPEAWYVVTASVQQLSLPLPFA
jgi:hypothetical protein